jgi:hypothetical protein
MVIAAPGVEVSATPRAGVWAGEILLDRYLPAAGSAKDCLHSSFVVTPNRERMIGDRAVTILAGKVPIAALHLDRDDIERRAIVSAASLRVHLNPTDVGTPIHQRPPNLRQRIGQRTSGTS